MQSQAHCYIKCSDWPGINPKGLVFWPSLELRFEQIKPPAEGLESKFRYEVRAERASPIVWMFQVQGQNPDKVTSFITLEKKSERVLHHTVRHFHRIQSNKCGEFSGNPDHSKTIRFGLKCIYLLPSKDQWFCKARYLVPVWVFIFGS